MIEVQTVRTVQTVQTVQTLDWPPTEVFPPPLCQTQKNGMRLVQKRRRPTRSKRSACSRIGLEVSREC